MLDHVTALFFYAGHYRLCGAALAIGEAVSKGVKVALASLQAGTHEIPREYTNDALRVPCTRYTIATRYDRVIDDFGGLARHVECASLDLETCHCLRWNECVPALFSAKKLSAPSLNIYGAYFSFILWRLCHEIRPRKSEYEYGATSL